MGETDDRRRKKATLGGVLDRNEQLQAGQGPWGQTGLGHGFSEGIFTVLYNHQL